MQDKLQTIFEGSVYILTIILILTGIFFTITAGIEAYQSHYWNGISSLAGAGLSFLIVTLTSRYIIKENNK